MPVKASGVCIIKKLEGEIRDKKAVLAELRSERIPLVGRCHGSDDVPDTEEVDRLIQESEQVLEHLKRKLERLLFAQSDGCTCFEPGVYAHLRIKNGDTLIFDKVVTLTADNGDPSRGLLSICTPAGKAVYGKTIGEHTYDVSCHAHGKTEHIAEIVDLFPNYDAIPEELRAAG